MQESVAVTPKYDESRLGPRWEDYSFRAGRLPDTSLPLYLGSVIGGVALSPVWHPAALAALVPFASVALRQAAYSALTKGRGLSLSFEEAQMRAQQVATRLGFPHEIVCCHDLEHPVMYDRRLQKGYVSLSAARSKSSAALVLALTDLTREASKIDFQQRYGTHFDDESSPIFQEFGLLALAPSVAYRDAVTTKRNRSEPAEPPWFREPRASMQTVRSADGGMTWLSARDLHDRPAIAAARDALEEAFIALRKRYPDVHSAELFIGGSSARSPHLCPDDLDADIRIWCDGGSGYDSFHDSPEKTEMYDERWNAMRDELLSSVPEAFSRIFERRIQIEPLKKMWWERLQWYRELGWFHSQRYFYMAGIGARSEDGLYSYVCCEDAARIFAKHDERPQFPDSLFRSPEIHRALDSLPDWSVAAVFAPSDSPVLHGVAIVGDEVPLLLVCHDSEGENPDYLKHELLKKFASAGLSTNGEILMVSRARFEEIKNLPGTPAYNMLQHFLTGGRYIKDLGWVHSHPIPSHLRTRQWYAQNWYRLSEEERSAFLE